MNRFLVAAVAAAALLFASQESHAQQYGPVNQFGAFGDVGFGYGFYPHSMYGYNPALFQNPNIGKVRKAWMMKAFVMSMKNAPTIGTMTKASGDGP